MKFTSAVIVLLSSVSLVHAQETKPESKQKKTDFNNEIGLMADMSIGLGERTLGLQGIQYKHWRNKTMAYRIAFGAGKYYEQGTERFLPSGSGDSVYSRRVNYELPMACLAIGVELQKKFYRRLYFYGGLELKGGYGKGHYDTMYLKRSVYDNSYGSSYGDRQLSTASSAYYGSFSPVFGLKLNFRRLVVGAEFSSPMQFASKAGYSGNESGLDFSMNNFHQRVYIHYRFK